MNMFGIKALLQATRLLYFRFPTISYEKSGQKKPLAQKAVFSQISHNSRKCLKEYVINSYNNDYYHYHIVI